MLLNGHTFTANNVCPFLAFEDEGYPTDNVAKAFIAAAATHGIEIIPSGAAQESAVELIRRYRHEPRIDLDSMNWLRCLLAAEAYENDKDSLVSGIDQLIAARGVVNLVVATSPNVIGEITKNLTVGSYAALAVEDDQYTELPEASRAANSMRTSAKRKSIRLSHAGRNIRQLSIAENPSAERNKVEWAMGATLRASVVNLAETVVMVVHPDIAELVISLAGNPSVGDQHIGDWYGTLELDTNISPPVSGLTVLRWRTYE
ncbi:MAG: hypothetical protein AAF413_03900 [Patescibacteria group bacterium]